MSFNNSKRKKANHGINSPAPKPQTSPLSEKKRKQLKRVIAGEAAVVGGGIGVIAHGVHQDKLAYGFHAASQAHYHHNMGLKHYFGTGGEPKSEHMSDAHMKARDEYSAEAKANGVHVTHYTNGNTTMQAKGFFRNNISKTLGEVK